MLSDKPQFTIGEVARSLGVSPHTIRAWERRYGLPAPERRSGQRVYSAEDVDLLLRVSYAASAHRRSLRLAALEAQGLLDDEISRGRERVEQHVLSSRPPSTDTVPWHEVADRVPQLLLLLDSAGVIVDCNVATARTLDTVREKLRGAHLADLVVEYDRAKAARLYRAPFKARRGWELRLRSGRSRRLVVAFDSFVLAVGRTRLLGLFGRLVLDEAL